MDKNQKAKKAKCTSMNTECGNAAFFVLEVMGNDKNISRINEIIPDLQKTLDTAVLIHHCRMK